MEFIFLIQPWTIGQHSMPCALILGNRSSESLFSIENLSFSVILIKIILSKLQLCQVLKQTNLAVKVICITIIIEVEFHRVVTNTDCMQRRAIEPSHNLHSAMNCSNSRISIKYQYKSSLLETSVVLWTMSLCLLIFIHNYAILLFYS